MRKGKREIVKIKRERFKEMFIIRKISEKKFGTQLEQAGIIAYRSLQRNLQSETMKKDVLMECAQRLNCSPYYLQGIANAGVEDMKNQHTSYPDDPDYDLYYDSQGVYIESYRVYLAGKGFDEQLKLFRAWAENVSTYINGKEYTFDDTVQRIIALEKEDGVRFTDSANAGDEVMLMCQQVVTDWIKSWFIDEVKKNGKH